MPYDSPAGGGLGNFTPIHPIDQLSQLPFYGDEICSIIGKHLLEKSSSVLEKAFKKESKSYPRAISE